jgi:hypothetical protein
VPSKQEGRLQSLHAQIAFETGDARWRIADTEQNLGDDDYATGRFLFRGLCFGGSYFNPPSNWSITVRCAFN